MGASRKEIYAKVDAFREEMTENMGASKEEIFAKVDAFREEMSAKVETLTAKVDA